MATFSGKNGKIMVGAATLADITRWTIDTQSNNPSYASSSTAGFKKRVAGVKDANGTFDYKLDPAGALSATLVASSGVTLLLYEDATHNWSVPAVIDRVARLVDIDNGEVVGGAAEFSANGQWTEPTYP